MKNGMLKLLLPAALALAGVMLPSVGHAQSYPWCAVYGGPRGGGAQNCGFNSFAQCQATVAGVGGFCQRNPLYEPPRKKRSG